MATQIKNIVSFANVAVGATVALPHGLAISPPGGGDLPQVPDLVIPDRSGFTVTADDTNVTVTNNTGAVRSVDVYVETWHSLERAFGPQATLELAPRPFVVNLDSGGGSGSGAILSFGERELTQVADDVNDMSPWFEDNNEAGPQDGPIGIPVPRAGTIRNLFVRHSLAAVAGSVSYMVTKNGVATALSVVGLNSAAIGQGSDLVTSFTVVPGDVIAMTATIGEEGGGGAVGAVATMLFDD